MSQPVSRFTNTLLGISAIGAAFLMCQAAISGADVWIFHVLYISLIVLLAIMCTSTNMRSGVVIATLSVVLVVIWVFSNASYRQPVLYNSDLNTELTIVQHLLVDNHLPRLADNSKVAYYASYPGIELMATALELVSGIGAIDFLGYGAAILSGTTILLVLAFYRRLLPQSSLATKATVVAAFSCSMISYGALAVHETYALVFVWLLFAVLSLAGDSGRSSYIVFCLASVAIIISHILTGFLFLILTATYVLCMWIPKLRKRQGAQIFQGRHLFLYVTIFLLWDVYISAVSVTTGRDVMLSVLSYSWRQYVASAAVPTGTKPAWVVTLTILGFLLYGLVTLVGLFATIRSARSRLANLISIALSGGTGFLILFCLPIGLRATGAGLQARGFLYAYLFGAPLFIVGLSFVSTRKLFVFRSRPFRRILSLFILAVVLSPAVYYALPSFLYDRTSPLQWNDIRLGYAAEYTTYVFASRFSSPSQVLAVEIAADMRTDLINLSNVAPRYNGGFQGLVLSHDYCTMMMRQSITRVQDSDYVVSTVEYQYLLETSNIVYSSGDPFVLYATYCT
jgi:hypothetical protein